MAAEKGFSLVTSTEKLCERTTTKTLHMTPTTTFRMCLSLAQLNRRDTHPNTLWVYVGIHTTDGEGGAHLVGQRLTETMRKAEERNLTRRDDDYVVCTRCVCAYQCGVGCWDFFLLFAITVAPD